MHENDGGQSPAAEARFADWLSVQAVRFLHEFEHKQREEDAAVRAKHGAHNGIRIKSALWLVDQIYWAAQAETWEKAAAFLPQVPRAYTMAHDSLSAWLDDVAIKIRNLTHSAEKHPGTFETAAQRAVSARIDVLREALAKSLRVASFETNPAPSVPTTATAAVANRGKMKNGRGRRRGVGGYVVADAERVEEMHGLITSGQASSAWPAAQMVAHKAMGSSAPDNREKRLVKRYREKYGE